MLPLPTKRKKKKYIIYKMILLIPRGGAGGSGWRAFEHVSEDLRPDLTSWFRKVCKGFRGRLAAPITLICLFLITHTSLSFFLSLHFFSSECSFWVSERELRVITFIDINDFKKMWLNNWKILDIWLKFIVLRSFKRKGGPNGCVWDDVANNVGL